MSGAGARSRNPERSEGPRKKKATAGPVSRILSACLAAGRTVIPLGHALLRSSSDLPGGECAPSQHADARSAAPSLFGLAPCGVCPARSITGAAVRSYRTFSPLPGAAVARAPGRYIFCGTFRRNGLEPTRPDVIRHTALWSSDFPPLLPRGLDESSVRRAGATVRSGCQPPHYSGCCAPVDRLPPEGL